MEIENPVQELEAQLKILEEEINLEQAPLSIRFVLADNEFQDVMNYCRHKEKIPEDTINKYQERYNGITSKLKLPAQLRQIPKRGRGRLKTTSHF